MAGYNPVSGGLLNMLTGGAYGEPTQYGLENLLQKDSQILEILYKINMVYQNEQIEDVLSEIEETEHIQVILGLIKQWVKPQIYLRIYLI
jgi:hypothetical protein